MTAKKHISISLFGALKEDLGGKSQMQFQLTEGTTSISVKELLETLVLLYPEVKYLPVCKVAANLDVVTDDSMIKAGDELVLMPPFAGG